MAENKVVVGVAAVLINKNHPDKVLVIQEQFSNTSIGKKSGMIAIPMGHLEPNESPLDRLKAEIAEETGYTKAKIQGLLGFYLIKGALGIVYVAKISGKQSTQIDKGVGNVKWTNPNTLINSENLRPGVKQIVQDFIDNKPLLPTNSIKVCF